MTIRVILCDLDGVLTHRDTFTFVTREQLRRSAWRALMAVPAVPFLVVTRGRPGLHGYFARYLVRIAFLNWRTADAHEYLAETGRRLARTPGWLVADGVQRLQGHLDNGDRVIVTTATEHVLARAFLDSAGLGDVEVVASELQRSRSGLRLNPHNYWPEKPRRLLGRGDGPPWTVIYTDSLADLPLMFEAERSVVINPPRNTARIASNRVRNVKFEWWE